MNRPRSAILLCVLILVPMGLLAEGVAEAMPRPLAVIDEDDSCLSCHQALTPGIAYSWRLSKHAFAAVGCATCHNGMKGDPSSLSSSV